MTDDEDVGGQYNQKVFENRAYAYVPLDEGTTIVYLVKVKRIYTPRTVRQHHNDEFRFVHKGEPLPEGIRWIAYHGVVNGDEYVLGLFLGDPDHGVIERLGMDIINHRFEPVSIPEGDVDTLRKAAIGHLDDLPRWFTDIGFFDGLEERVIGLMLEGSAE